jgi:hypothetical protein
VDDLGTIDATPPSTRSSPQSWGEVNYDEYIRSPAWASVRRDILDRAHGQCERCGEHARLSVHHKHYGTLGDEAPDDLEALCDDCHDDADRERTTEARDQYDDDDGDDEDNRRFRARLNGWASKVFGMDWRNRCDADEVEAEFRAWLDEKGED